MKFLFHRLRNDQNEDVGGENHVPLSGRAHHENGLRALVRRHTTSSARATDAIVTLRVDTVTPLSVTYLHGPTSPLAFDAQSTMPPRLTATTTTLSTPYSLPVCSSELLIPRYHCVAPDHSAMLFPGICIHGEEITCDLGRGRDHDLPRDEQGSR